MTSWPRSGGGGGETSILIYMYKHFKESTTRRALQQQETEILSRSSSFVRWCLILVTFRASCLAAALLVSEIFTTPLKIANLYFSLSNHYFIRQNFECEENTGRFDQQSAPSQRLYSRSHGSELNWCSDQGAAELMGLREGC